MGIANNDSLASRLFVLLRSPNHAAAALNIAPTEAPSADSNSASLI